MTLCVATAYCLNEHPSKCMRVRGAVTEKLIAMKKLDSRSGLCRTPTEFLVYPKF